MSITTTPNANEATNFEYYQLWLPYFDEEDLNNSMFRFTFQTVPSPDFSVAFAIDINPILQTPPSDTPLPFPTDFNYTFDKNNICQLSPKNATFGEYSINGQIQIISQSYGNGQFDNTTKNFLFELSMGTKAEPNGISGLFPLLLIEAPALETSNNTTDNPPITPDNSGTTTDNPPVSPDNSGTTTDNPPITPDNSDTTTDNPPVTLDNSDTTTDNKPAKKAEK